MVLSNMVKVTLGFTGLFAGGMVILWTLSKNLGLLEENTPGTELLIWPIFLGFIITWAGFITCLVYGLKELRRPSS